MSKTKIYYTENLTTDEKERIFDELDVRKEFHEFYHDSILLETDCGLFEFFANVTEDETNGGIGKDQMVWYHQDWSAFNASDFKEGIDYAITKIGTL